MILPDVNLILYAEIDAFPQHRAARAWWEGAMSGDRPVGLAAVVLFGFVRIATSRRIFTAPLAIDDALARVRAWLARPNAALLTPGARHLDIAFGLLASIGTGANLTTDAQIAAHALEVGGEVFSNDPDFARFPNLRWSNPLAPR